MTEYIINVGAIESLQITRDSIELNQIFSRAQSTVVQGGKVVLVRQSGDGRTYRFDEMTTEADIEIYKRTVFKYV